MPCAGLPGRACAPEPRDANGDSEIKAVFGGASEADISVKPEAPKMQACRPLAAASGSSRANARVTRFTTYPSIGNLASVHVNTVAPPARTLGRIQVASRAPKVKIDTVNTLSNTHHGVVRVRRYCINCPNNRSRLALQGPP